MEAIQTAQQTYDGFSGFSGANIFSGFDGVSNLMLNIKDSISLININMGELQSTMREPIDTSRLIDARSEIDSTAEALEELSTAAQNVEQPEISVPEQPAEGKPKVQKAQSVNPFSGIMESVGNVVNLDNIGKVMDWSDTMTRTTSALNQINDGMQTTRELQDMIYASSMRTHSSYLDTSNTVAKMGNSAGNAFGSNEELVAFVEQADKQFSLGGAAPEQKAGAMEQLTQGMAAGGFGQDALNSILETAPEMANAIEQSMGWAKGSLRSYAEEGAVTAQVVKDSLLNMAGDTNAKFAEMPMTFSQAMTDVQSSALLAFQPVLEKINEMVNSEGFQSFVNGAITALSVLAGIALNVFDVISSAIGFIAENWSVLAPIIYTVVAALGVYCLWQMIAAAATALISALPMIMLVMAIALVIALFYAAVGAINQFAGTSISATGLICGAFMTALAFIGNIFITLWNLIVDGFVLIYNLVAMVANFLGNVFDDPVGSVCRLFFDLADTVLGVLETLASAVDTIFGSDLAGSVQGWRDSLSGWVDDTFGEEKEVMKKLDANDFKLERFEYDEAFDMGYAFGEGIDDKVSGFNLSDLFGNSMPNPDDYKQELNGNGMGSEGAGGGYGNAGAGYGVNNPMDPGGQLGTDVSDISENTGSMADAMEISEEDLKYLRDLAEQETVNRFTTAAITIEQTNNNNVSSGMDLDGVVLGLTDAVNEAVEIITEGVHV